VFAIPGSIRNPLARGCHQLIRNGARLVESAAEIIEELAPLARRLGLRLRERLAEGDALADPPPPSPSQDPERARLLAALDEDPVGIDELAARSGFGVARLASLLLLLELDGAVVATPGGAWARRMQA
jgi:DNA processing protein